MREYWLDPPEQESLPVCPVCGEECETIYTDISSEVCGCENCLTEYDSCDYFGDEDEGDPDYAFESRFDTIIP